MVRSELYFLVDPMYAETARIVVESGLCLALEGGRLPVKGGRFFSPYIATGDVLLQVLCKIRSKFASKVVTFPNGVHLKSNYRIMPCFNKIEA